MSSPRRRVLLLFGFLVALTLGAVDSAFAVTRVMPPRPAIKGEDVVLWGNTTLAVGTPFTLDCGNGVTTSGNVTDPSYLSRTCNYGSEGTFTASLTVGAETATVAIAVFDPALHTATETRDTRINMAIESGLRFLYFSQTNRQASYTTNMTSWSGNSVANNNTAAYTALATLAIQNHGHSVLANPNTDIFQTVVQRALNFIFDGLVQQDMTPCSEPGGNPCINVPAPVNIGLRSTGSVGFGFSDSGYVTPILAAVVAAAAGSAPGRTVGAGIGSQNANFVAGKTYAEILQRIANVVVWGQSDQSPGRGGWYYNLQAGNVSDGSTMGWGLLGLIDAGGGGATVPAFAKTEYAMVLANQLNTDGTLDYQVDANSTPSSSNMAKTGIGIQGMAFTGRPQSDPFFKAALHYLVTNWNSQTLGFTDFQCSGGSPSPHNKGCGYAMFNIFKGLRLYGITSLCDPLNPAVCIPDPDGAGPLSVGDWYGDYVNNLLTNEHQPGNPNSGEWSTAAPSMGWSCCASDTTGITSLALLILSPVAFVPPDPVLFSTIGLAPANATNPPGTSHTVTATARSSNQQPVPGVTIDIKVMTGPNAGASGSGVTDANGEVKFTYTDTSTPPYPKTDTIQAFIGTLGSNVVNKVWQPSGLVCDVDADGDVDLSDLQKIAAKNRQKASGASDPFDPNHDGKIDVADVRVCQLRLTAPSNTAR